MNLAKKRSYPVYKNCRLQSCGKSFPVYTAKQMRKQFCSPKCVKEWRSITTSGKGNPNYTTGEWVGADKDRDIHNEANRIYQKKNKAAIAARENPKRKLRYATDPKYRERRREIGRKSYERNLEKSRRRSREKERRKRGTYERYPDLKPDELVKKSGVKKYGET